MTVDRLRVEPNERVDIEDFRSIGESDANNMRQLGHKFFMEESVETAEDRTGYIMSGFEPSNPTGTQVQVDKGIALLSQRFEGAVYQGVLTTGGDASIILDISSYASGTYGIYIRFEEINATPQGRIFWNPAGDGSEYVQFINTRFQAKWGLRIESASPGAEWLKIAEVDRDSMDVTDMRPFYYEGSVDSAYLSGWGSSALGGTDDDRDPDRSKHGVTNLHTFVQSMKQCIEDIKGRGIKRWWESSIGGMNIGFDEDPSAGRLAIGDAEFYMEVSGDEPSMVVNNDTTESKFYYDRSINTFGLTINDVTNHVFHEEKLHTHDLELDGEVVSDLIPPDSTYNLGENLNRWFAGYFDSLFGYSITIGTGASEGCSSDFIPTSDGGRNLGYSTRRWYAGHVQYMDIHNQLKMEAGASVDGNLTPTGTHVLGESGNRWSEGWFTDLYVADVGSSIVPKATGIWIGTSSDPWDRGYFTDLYLDGEVKDNVVVADGKRVIESEAEYLWNRGDAHIDLTDTTITVATPKTEIISNGIEVNASGELEVSSVHEGYYKVDCVFMCRLLTSGSEQIIIGTYLDGTIVSNSNVTVNLDSNTVDTPVSYTFIADLTDSTKTVSVRISKATTSTPNVRISSASKMTVCRCRATV